MVKNTNPGQKGPRAMLSNIALLLSTAATNPNFRPDTTNGTDWELGVLARDVKTKLGMAGRKGEAVIFFRRTEAELAQFPEFIRPRVAGDRIFWSFSNGCLTAVAGKVVRS